MIRDIDLMIIGGGPAGLMAALAAAEAAPEDAKILLCERDEALGGQLVKQTHKFFGSEKQHAGERGIFIGRGLSDAVHAETKIEVMTDATVLGLYEDGIVTVLNDDKHLKFRPRKLIVATGASEKFLAFPGNDLPGIYGAGAVQTLMNVSGVKPAERVVMVGAGNIGLIVSYQLLQAGVDVACVVEAAPKIGGYLVHASKLARSGVPIRTGWTVKEAFGDQELEGVVLIRLNENFQPIEGTEETVYCDTLCLAVGLSPLAELLYQADCEMTYVRELSGAVPVVDEDLMTSVSGIYVCGDVSGIEEASSAMVEGRLAGFAAAKALGWNADLAQAEIEKAREELNELRSGPTGARIRAGIAKVQERREGSC